MQDGPTAPEQIIPTAPKPESPRPTLPASQFPGGIIPNRGEFYKGKLAATRGKLEAAQRVTMYDSKTGLHNDRWLDERIDTAIKSSQRSGQGFYLLFMDLDNFKQYNSRFDHSGGDKVLRLFKRIQTRPSEDVARYGGDEFAQVLNDDIKLEEAISVAVRNANTVSEQSRSLIPHMIVFNKETPPIDNVTMSLGLIECDGNMTKEDILARASQAMLEGKNSGKDLITVSTKEGKIKMFNREGIEINPENPHGRFDRLLAPVQRFLKRKVA